MKLFERTILMKVVARAVGIKQFGLERGLVITLRYLKESRLWTLSLTRKNVWPSEKEEEICREAFRVPAECERDTERKGEWNIVRFVWEDEFGARLRLAQGHLAPGMSLDKFNKVTEEVVDFRDIGKKKVAELNGLIWGE